jgi:hypothetical protein
MAAIYLVFFVSKFTVSSIAMTSFLFLSDSSLFITPGKSIINLPYSVFRLILSMECNDA